MAVGIMIEMVMTHAVVPADWDGRGPITVLTAWGPMCIAVPEGFSAGQEFSFQMAKPATQPATQPVAPVAKPVANPGPKPVATAVAKQSPAQGKVHAPQPQVMAFNRDPQQHTCPHCSQTTLTQVNKVAGCGTHLIALGLCCFVPGCCCVPYCCDGCKCGLACPPVLNLSDTGSPDARVARRDAEHPCGHCGQVVGTKKIF